MGRVLVGYRGNVNFDFIVIWWGYLFFYFRKDDIYKGDLVFNIWMIVFIMGKMRY